MRILIQETIQILISAMLALLVYAIPLTLIMVNALLPDAEQLIIDQIPDREVSLAEEGKLLANALVDEPSDSKDVTPDPPSVSPPAPATPDPPPDPPKKAEKPTPPPPVDATTPLPSPARVLPTTKSTIPLRSTVTDARTERMASLKARAETKAGGSKAGKKQKCADPPPGVTKTSDHEYTVDRDLVMRYAGDLDAASRLAYVAWSKDESGDTNGFVVRHIRCGTLLDEVGIKNGDVIQAVNGKPVHSILQAFSAWRKVQKKDVVKITINRKGEKVEIKYHIA